MKRIIKSEPRFYSNFLVNKKPTTWKDIDEIRHIMRIYMLSGLVPDETIEGHQAISEQNNQCAYTEINIDDDAISSHIDHFRKQSLFPNLKFDWKNLFTSTISNDYGGKYKDETYKIKQEEYQYLINPSTENPNDFFEYSFTGQILIKVKDENSIEYKKAKLTIDAFNLNDKSLINRRKTVATNIINFNNQLSINEIKENIGEFDSFVEYIYSNAVYLLNNQK